jgi:hypothetical protein
VSDFLVRANQNRTGHSANKGKERRRPCVLTVVVFGAPHGPMVERSFFSMVVVAVVACFYFLRKEGKKPRSINAQKWSNALGSFVVHQTEQKNEAQQQFHWSKILLLFERPRHLPGNDCACNVCGSMCIKVGTGLAGHWSTQMVSSKAQQMAQTAQTRLLLDTGWTRHTSVASNVASPAFVPDTSSHTPAADGPPAFVSDWNDKFPFGGATGDPCDGRCGHGSVCCK